jgi:hypothetical protein
MMLRKEVGYRYLGTVLNKVDKAGHQELQQAVNLDIKYYLGN